MRALALLLLLVAAPAAGLCPGDCNGDGQVRVEELVSGVGLALDGGAVESCAALDGNGDGAIGIDELVRAVTALLGGCPATPTPTEPPPLDTPTATPTAEDTATPTATPTLPPIGGAWVEAALTVDESSCPQPLTAAFAEELAERGPCAQTVVLTGEASVRVTDCAEQEVDGAVERDGTIQLTFPPSPGGVEGCTLVLSTSSVIPAGQPAVRARYTFAIAFDENCGLADCTIIASGDWTRP